MKPASDRGLSVQREPAMWIALVSKRSPATVMNTWPALEYTLTHLPGPGAPIVDQPRAIGFSSSPAWMNANDSEPEQS